MSLALVLGAERPVAGYMGPTSPTSPTALGALGGSGPQLQFADVVPPTKLIIHHIFKKSQRTPSVVYKLKQLSQSSLSSKSSDADGL